MNYRNAAPYINCRDGEANVQLKTADLLESFEISRLRRNTWIGRSVFLVFLLAASLSSADWTSAGMKHGCEIFTGDAVGTIAPVRAVCDWPISADSVIQTLDRTDNLEAVFSTVEQSAVLGSDSDGGDLVYQSYRMTPFFKREVVLAMSSEPIPDGRRFSWRKASDQSALTGTRIEIDRTENLWEVTGSAEHCHVVLELSFAPGGNVPAFIIDWLQGAGVKDQLGELRRYAASRSNNSENPNRTR